MGMMDDNFVVRAFRWGSPAAAATASASIQASAATTSSSNAPPPSSSDSSIQSERSSTPRVQQQQHEAKEGPMGESEQNAMQANSPIRVGRVVEEQEGYLLVDPPRTPTTARLALAEADTEANRVREDVLEQAPSVEAAPLPLLPQIINSQPLEQEEAAATKATRNTTTATTITDSSSSSNSSSSSSSSSSNNSSSNKSNSSLSPGKAASAQIMRRQIPVEESWREKLSLVLLQDKPTDETPVKVIKRLSGALVIEATADGAHIEIQAREWQVLKEAEALLRLTFRDYDGVSLWWFYTLPSFVACIIAGTTGTVVPEFCDPSVGLKCSIAPYDENSTRRAFFLTGSDWGHINQAYTRIQRGWEYWRRVGVERQIDHALGVLHGVFIVPIKADGNCLFRAFAKAIMGEEERHLETRKAVVDFMRASEELRLFIVSDDDGEDSVAYTERYLDEMEKDGTWGDQVEITAFTRVYSRAVRCFSYNYMESRLVSVLTPLVAGDDMSDPKQQAPQEGSSELAETAGGPGKEVWLLHLHGHYSLLLPGITPKDRQWERMLREEKGASLSCPSFSLAMPTAEEQPGEGRVPIASGLDSAEEESVVGSPLSEDVNLLSPQETRRGL